MPAQTHKKMKALGLSVVLLSQAHGLSGQHHADFDGIAISAGGHHACALEYRSGVDFGGPLRCWGYNHHGQATPPPGIFVQISAGTYHTCGITTRETVQCWGMPMDSPTGRFLQVSVGEWHACGLLKGGAVVCWGRNDDSQLNVPPGIQFVQISAGHDNTCGLSRDGNIACWGAQPGGGYKNTTETFRQVSAGSKAAVSGLTVKGELICWGAGRPERRLDGPFMQISTSPYRTCGILERNQRIQCLDADSHAYIPEAARSMEWSELSVGGDHFCAINEEGEFHCFGRHLNLFGSSFITSPEDFQVA